MRVEGRHHHVRGHDRRDAFRDGGAERHQLDRLEPRPFVLDDRQRVVRIDVRIAVSGKVFAARRDARALQPAYDRATETRHGARGGGQRAIADDGVGLVRMDVEHRRVVEVDPDGSQLRRERRGEPLGQPLVVRYGRASARAAIR